MNSVNHEIVLSWKHMLSHFPLNEFNCEMNGNRVTFPPIFFIQNAPGELKRKSFMLKMSIDLGAHGNRICRLPAEI